MCVFSSSVDLYATYVPAENPSEGHLRYFLFLFLCFSQCDHVNHIEYKSISFSDQTLLFESIKTKETSSWPQGSPLSSAEYPSIL